jgi:hypothetical protein
MKITKGKHSISASTKPIMAADEDFNEYSEDEISATLDDVSDAVDDMQEVVDDIQDDDIDIEMDNNIDGHYIAQCDSCHGIFISAMIESDQEVQAISGVCPICGKDTSQDLKWIVRSV